MISIERVSISGFKSFRRLQDIELRALNVIVGANGAGKSNFIQLLRLVKALAQGEFQTFIMKHGEADAFLHHGPKTTPRLEVSLQFTGPDDSSPCYSFSLEPDADQRFLLTERLGARLTAPLPAPSRESQLLTSVSESPDALASVLGQAIRHWEFYHFHDTSPTAGMRRSEIVDDHLRLRPCAENLASFLLHLRHRHPQHYRQILWTIQTVIPFLEDFDLTVYQAGEAEKVKLTWFQKHGNHYPMQPYQLSDGSMRFICLATALLQPKLPSAIIIDEPELGLHPEAIEVLAGLLKTAATHTQVLVATQSPQLLDALSVEDIVVARRDHGSSTLQRLSPEDLNSWLEEYSLGELWRKNVIQGGTCHEP